MPKRPERTTLYLVCSPLGGVGKTLTARLLLEHAAGTNPKTVGFDTNHLDPDLERLFPLVTTVVDLSTIQGQMNFFDRLVVADGVPKVVDLWHATYDLFWAQTDRLGFFREAHAQGVDVVLFLQADRKDRFASEVQTLPFHGPHMTFVLVHNQALMDRPRSEPARVALVAARHVLVVPEFDAVTQPLLEETGTLSRRFAEANPQDAFATGGRLAKLNNIFDQLRFLDLCVAKARA